MSIPHSRLTSPARALENRRCLFERQAADSGTFVDLESGAQAHPTISISGQERGRARFQARQRRRSRGAIREGLPAPFPCSRRSRQDGGITWAGTAPKSNRRRGIGNTTLFFDQTFRRLGSAADSQGRHCVLTPTPAAVRLPAPHALTRENWGGRLARSESIPRGITLGSERQQGA